MSQVSDPAPPSLIGSPSARSSPQASARREWFDWTIYATFAVYFSSQFFDKSNPTLALIGTTSTYALAFFFRPLGGVLLGRLADLRGRRFRHARHDHADGGRSLLIAVLPTYSLVGWLARILLLVARIAPGLSLGARCPTPAPTSPRSRRRTAAPGTPASSTSPRVPRCSPPRCSACC